MKSEQPLVLIRPPNSGKKFIEEAKSYVKQVEDLNEIRRSQTRKLNLIEYTVYKYTRKEYTEKQAIKKIEKILKEEIDGKLRKYKSTKKDRV